MSSLFARLFPIPSFFTLPTVGLDFSDVTMRFIRLEQGKHGIVPTAFADLAIPEGCLENGRIVDEKNFVSFLKEVRTKHNLKYVRVSIPESQVYAVTLPIDAAARDNVRAAIELVLEDNIPLPAVETIFDYQVLSVTDKTILVQVVALAEKVAQSYLTAFTDAGLIPVSFEVESQAITRAVQKSDDKRSCMIVDIGGERTGITIATNGTAIYTSTLEFGGSTLVSLVTKALGVDTAEAHKTVHHGLSIIGPNKNIFEMLSGGISVLREEIDRRYVYWHERKDQFGAMIPAIDTIYLCGGYSTIEGLAEYLTSSLGTRVVVANPWINCLSFDTEIPALTHDEAQSYVTAIGLALSDYLYD